MKTVLLVCGVVLSMSTGCGSSTAPPSVALVSISPNTVSLVAGAIEQKQLAVVTSSASGSVLSGRVVTWATSDKNVAVVSSDGLVKGIAAGTATITATSEGKTGSAVINVLPMTESLTGMWNAAIAGPLSNLHLQLTEVNTETVTGQWTGYVAGCTASNDAQCLRSGLVVRGYRHGSSAQLELAANSPCGVANATITGMFARFDSVSGLVTEHICNDSDRAPTPTTLARQ